MDPFKKTLAQKHRLYMKICRECGVRNSSSAVKCRKCRRPLPARYHIDHIKEFSGGGSDRASNLQALCPNCHAQKTEDDRMRKRQKKIRESERRERDPLGGLFGAPRGRKPKSPFDISLGPKPRRGRKPKSPFDIDIGLGPKKRRRKKKKGPFDLF